jgi:cyclic nucleotide gated channel
VASVALDPLFYYNPRMNDVDKCFDLDNTVAIFTDAFYALHIFFQFRTGFVAPSSLVFGRGNLVDDPKAIAKRYLLTYFIIDILSILPLPQVCIWHSKYQ